MWGFIGNIGPWELVLILLIALIVVGPGKLPEVGRALGKAVNQFQKATSGVKSEIEDVIRLDDKPSSASNINIKPEEKTKGELLEQEVFVAGEVAEEADNEKQSQEI